MDSQANEDPAVLFANAKAGRQEKRGGKDAEANSNETETAKENQTPANLQQETSTDTNNKDASIEQNNNR